MDTLEQVLKRTYDLVRFTNHRNFIMEDWSMEPFISLSKVDRRNIELIQSPDVTGAQNHGSCYDQTFLVKKWMDGIGIENRTFHSITSNVPKENGRWFYRAGVTSHVFILCFIDQKWKWIEWSWYANIKNRFESPDIMEVLKMYRSMAENSWHHPIHLCEVKDVSLPVPRLTFMNDCMKLDDIRTS